MAVDESLDALSTTAASNTPLGTDNVGTDLDDNLRDIKKNIRIAAEHAQGILNPTGFEGRLHADKSRSASGIVTLRLYHDEWSDLFEFDTASAQIKVINLNASSIPSITLNISPLAVTRGGIGQESSASASAYIQALINPASVPISAAQGGTGQESSASSSAYINVMLGTLLALSRKATVGDADIAISAEATGDIIVHGGAGGDWNRFGVGSASEMLHVSGGTWALRSPPGAAGGAWTLIGTQTGNQASYTVTGLDSTYDTYAIALSDIVPATDNTSLKLRVGDSAGIDSGASDYSWGITSPTHQTTPNMDNSGDDLAAEMMLTQNRGVGNAAGEGFGAMLFLHRPSDGSTNPNITGTIWFMAADAIRRSVLFGASRLSAITLDRIQIIFSSGNVSSGRMTVWGISHT